jgi:SAM-dependent methyltransferase
MNNDGRKIVRKINNVDFISRNECIINSNHKLNHIRTVESVDAVYGNSDILFCEECGIGYTSPFPSPETVAELYNDRSQSLNFTGGEGGSDEKDIMSSIKRYLAKKSVDALIKQHVNPNNLLDFGCGNGSFALIAHQTYANLEVTALDFHEQAPAQLDGTRVHYMSYDNFNRSENKYDIIHLRAVLEHVHEPIRFLTMLRSHLNKDGFIYIYVPRPFNTWAKIWGKFSDYSYYIPFHITHFTPKGLVNIINMAGLYGTPYNIELPLTSNFLEKLFDTKLSNTLRIIGVLFFPLHLIVNKVTNKSNHLGCIARVMR